MIKRGLSPRFAEVGKIKIGGKGEKRKSKKPGGKEYQLPIRFEHFVVTTTEKGLDGNFNIDKTVMDKLGNEPKEISIRLPFDDIDMNFFTSFQYYVGNKCVCRGDGESADRTDKNGKTSKVECNPEKCEYLADGKCKVGGILSCHLPDSMEVGGVYRFRTHSWNSVSAILAALKYFSDNTNGVLQGLPLKLKFLKKATQDHGNVNIVTVVLDGIEMIKMRGLALEEFENRTRLGINMKQLEMEAKEVGFLSDTDDPEDVQIEYYPENKEPVIVIADDSEPGKSPDDVAEALGDKPEPPAPDNKSGSLL